MRDAVMSSTSLNHIQVHVLCRKQCNKISYTTIDSSGTMYVHNSGCNESKKVIAKSKWILLEPCHMKCMSTFFLLT